jgi:hypothetical protein
VENLGAALTPTVAMMVISMCSFLLKGPGLRECRLPNMVMPLSGRTRARNSPAGSGLCEYLRACTKNALTGITHRQEAGRRWMSPGWLAA